MQPPKTIIPLTVQDKTVGYAIMPGPNTDAVSDNRRKTGQTNRKAVFFLTDNIFEGNPKLLSPLTLAFVGDAVFELFVRERMIDRGDAPIGDLHLRKVDYVNCASQSEAVSVIEPFLTPEEEAVYKRGRNAHGNVPKNAKPQDYRRATGLEALFGWLYLSGEAARLRELFGIIWAAHEQSRPPKAQVEKAKPAGAVGVRLD